RRPRRQRGPQGAPRGFPEVDHRGLPGHHAGEVGHRQGVGGVVPPLSTRLRSPEIGRPPYCIGSVSIGWWRQPSGNCSRSITVPLKAAALGETRNSTASATSEGFMIRPRGKRFPSWSRKSSGWPSFFIIARSPSVSIQPGLMQWTRTRAYLSALAMFFEAVTIPAFEAA